ncbi:ThuA domain-containing protein [Robiginitalea sp. SC105]|uniref:ThuA domain-containing protein n=1 Tax=Robiginitalea sp. SC105 TaxID=2762332 RepID=UPI0016399F80|nr:ThuA domain-containing protein [Robiginitalea sp. SC105]MBC2839820.1 ThuA domain-containing protein [Robiginitalea sp. SC105]
MIPKSRNRPGSPYFPFPVISTCLYLVLCLAAFATLTSCGDNGPAVLVFSKTGGWQHSSIPFANQAIEDLGEANGYRVVLTQDADDFNDGDLKQYDAVIFNNTTGNVLNSEQQAAFQRYIQAGGGFVGIHSAADTEYEWPWYGRLVGAYFASHPHNPNVRPATIDITDSNHPATDSLPERWERTDEWYNYRAFYPGINVLAQLDEETYTGGTNGSYHPIAWYHEFDGGRAFYTGGGHEDASFSEPLFLKHLQGGIQYAMGPGRNLDYARATAVAVPEENRFEKTVLLNDLSIPMELDISEDGRIFYTELRSANLGVYDIHSGQQAIAHRFEVATEGGAGLIGVTLDPDFATNNLIYVYYSPPTEEETILFNLSRFVVGEDNTLDPDSELVLLQVPVQRNSGSHHGGSLAWDPEGNLILSTGDSSSPFPADGYAPLDERPGPEYFSLDAQRSAGNTNDLKGKILRIKPNYGPQALETPYTIPEGNLFEPGTAGTRPEIYVMGCRNPYRIAVNPETGTVYWGDIGPDAGEDGPQGPRGYDEFNQAKTAGNYGWPYFIGKNRAYTDWDFEKQAGNGVFDPQASVNDSPNNTGLNQLPPAREAMIWYPYAASEEFPDFGSGGRSAMAGAFYTYDPASDAPNRFPEYYDGTLFVFEWMRNWVKALRFDEAEEYVRAEPFMTENGDFRRPIDLVFGKDGILYMLEYGSVYGADNEDARLVQIAYNRGNRPPEAVAAIRDSAAQAALSQRVFITSELRGLPGKREIAGRAPLRVHFSSRGSGDPDDDETLAYAWDFEGEGIGSTERNPTHTFTRPGTYTARLQITDGAGNTASDSVRVTVGNEPPAIRFKSPDNKSFFWDGEPFRYTVEVTDPEDAAIDGEKVSVRFGYDANPGAAPGDAAERPVTARPYGYTLIERSDCRACHLAEGTSVGPSYSDIAKRYSGREDALEYLVGKVIRGGAGVWGESLMSAHPQLAPADVSEMVQYILSLSAPERELSELATEGVLRFDQHEPSEDLGRYTLEATYTDGGANGMPPITTREVLSLRSARVPMVLMDRYVGFERFGNYLTNAGHKAFYMMKDVDLTALTGFRFEYAAAGPAGAIEVRIDSQAGPVILKTPFPETGDWDTVESLEVSLDQPISGRHDLYFIAVRPEAPNTDIINLKAVNFLHD